MKAAVICLLLSLALASSTHSSEPQPSIIQDCPKVSLAIEKVLTTLGVSSDEVLDILEGILAGLGINLSIDEIQPCLTGLESLGNQLEDVFDDFSKLSIEGIEDGITKLGFALFQMYAAMQQCLSDLDSEAKTLALIIATIANPLSLIWKIGSALLWDGYDIYKTLSTADDYFDEGDFYHFGYYVGKALELLLL